MLSLYLLLARRDGGAAPPCKRNAVRHPGFVIDSASTAATVRPPVCGRMSERKSHRKLSSRVGEVDRQALAVVLCGCCSDVSHLVDRDVSTRSRPAQGMRWSWP
ncbi:hypothetical protein ACU686_05370 [Yinghuangia aomiensis]